MKPIKVTLFPALFSLFVSCSNNGAGTNTDVEAGRDSTEGKPSAAMIKEQAVQYSAGTANLNSYVAWDAAREGQRPVVLVLPEWWGLTDYPRMRASMLAAMGYLAMAVDMYGDGRLAANPQEAEKAATPFYTNPQLAKERINAAWAKAKSLPQADTTNLAIIGYCFGGSMAINYANMGEPVKGVVSFHGGLDVVPPQNGVNTEYLICHGAADDFVPQPQVDAFRKKMDSAGIRYAFKVYDTATHAFTNPNATEKGKQFNMPIRYNAEADKASWNDMQDFLRRILR